MDESAAKNDFRFPTMSPGMKKVIVGYLIIFVTLMGTAIGLQLVQQTGIGETRRQASTTGIDLSLTPSTTAQVNRGQTFTVTVFADPKGKRMTAADLTVTVDTTRFTIVSFTKGNMFDQATTPYGNNVPGTLLYDQTTGQGSVNNTNGTARIALGAVCDRCYLGAPTPIPTPGQPAIAPCLTNPTPACYPRTAAGQIGVLTLQVKANAPAGAGTIAFDTNNSQTAEVSSDVDATVDRTPISVTVAAAGPTPTPTGTTDRCAGADLSTDGTTLAKDGKVSASDYNYMMAHWTGSFANCPSNNCAGADLSTNGTTLGTDNKVAASDYNYMMAHWTGSFASCP
jgi:hypothetical protein